MTSINGLNTLSTDIPNLGSTQEEGDTKIVLHCLNIAENVSEDTSIIVRSSDTDVFILLLHYTQELQQDVLFDTGVSNKRRLVRISSVIEEVGKEMCSALPALHAFTGCDAISAFVRKGKVQPLNIIKQHEEVLRVFLQLGRQADVDDDMFEALERFTCLVYNNTTRATTGDINKLRLDKFLERYSAKNDILSTYDGVDLSLLPPCRYSLRMHAERANYQALIWYNADQADPNIPEPCGHGWDVTNGKLEIKWTSGNLMPQELVDLVIEAPDEDTDDANDEVPECESFLSQTIRH